VKRTSGGIAPNKLGYLTTICEQYRIWVYDVRLHDEEPSYGEMSTLTRCEKIYISNFLLRTYLEWEHPADSPRSTHPAR
jgi:hypothetical protein